MVAFAHRAPRARHPRLMRLSLSIVLCAFYLATFARVVSSEKAGLDAETLAVPSITEKIRIPYTELVPTATAPIEKRVKSDLSWDEATSIGKELYSTLTDQATRATPTPNTHNAKSKLETDYTRTPLAHEDLRILERLLIQDGIGIGKGADNKAELAAEKNGHSRYKNTYYCDRNNHVDAIVARNIERLPDEEVSLPWSEATFETYKTWGKKCDPKDLKYIYQFTILNTNTNDLIKMAMEKSESEESEECSSTWYVFEKETELFFAMLGSANGRGTARLLSDNTIAVGKKTITEIHVSQDPRAMKLVIGPI